MRVAASLLPVLVLPVFACRSVEITPAALRAPSGRTQDRAAALARWEEAVELANAFLASPWRLTLPPGRFELGESGMSFATEDGRSLVVAVTSSTWGDLVVASGGRAQEARGGFSVGAIDVPEGETLEPLLDHTFFRRLDGTWHDAESLARVTLHETTHVLYRTGAVGAWNTLAHYVVMAFTWRSATHPSEDRPRATSEEFAWFNLARSSPPDQHETIEALRDEHLADGRPHCEHGPFPARGR